MSNFPLHARIPTPAASKMKNAAQSPITMAVGKLVGCAVALTSCGGRNEVDDGRLGEVVILSVDIDVCLDEYVDVGCEEVSVDVMNEDVSVKRFRVVEGKTYTYAVTYLHSPEI